MDEQIAQKQASHCLLSPLPSFLAGSLRFGGTLFRKKERRKSLPFFNCLPRGNWSLPGKSFPVKRNYELLEARVSHATPREVKFAF